MTSRSLMFRALCALSPAILLLSCSSTRGIDTSKPIDPNEVIERVEARNARIQALRGYGTISVDTREIANSGGITVKLLKPDSLLLEISGPFGVGVAKAFITDKDFIFYNGADNTVVQGATTSANLRRALHIAIDFQEILAIVSGSFGFAEHPPSATRTTALDGKTYRITYTGPDDSMEYEIDLTYEAMRRFVHRAKNGDVLEEIQFRDFRKRSDLYLPAVVTLSRPSRDESITLVYDRQFLNDLPMDFAFHVPQTAMKIRL